MSERRAWFVLGAGRVGSVLADVLEGEGCLAGLWTRREERASRLAGRYRAPVCSGEPLIPDHADTVLVALPDGRVRSVLKTLATRDTHAGRVWLHTSGVHGAELLEGLGLRGSLGACHPLHSFQGDSADRGALRGGFMATDGSGEAMAAAIWLAKACGATAHPVPAAERGAYHLAAVLASNGVYALLQAADEICADINAQSGGALLRALASLAEGSARAAGRMGVGDAATGPVVRGDWETLQAHRRHLQSHAGHLETLYRELSLQLIRIAEKRGMRASQVRSIEHALLADLPREGREP